MGEPLVCRLDALTAEDRERHAALGAEIKSAVPGVEELADGWAFRFPPEARILRQLAEWIAFERLCCPFLDFALTIAGGAGESRLHVTGPEGVKGFLKSELALSAASEEGR